MFCITAIRELFPFFASFAMILSNGIALDMTWQFPKLFEPASVILHNNDDAEIILETWKKKN
jgi:hypothetical protein